MYYYAGIIMAREEAHELLNSSKAEDLLLAFVKKRDVGKNTRGICAYENISLMMTSTCRKFRLCWDQIHQ